ncbi:hypothetical protein vseg_009045 [Gypsophila vaccaria]
MTSSKNVSFTFTFTFTFLLLIFLKFTNAVDQITFLESNCSETQQYNTVFQNNLYHLLSNLTTESNAKKFHNFSTGDASNKVYGLFLCVTTYLHQVCQDCVTVAAGEVQRRCRSSNEATVWYAECMLRYADHDIFSVNDDSVYYNAGTGKSRFGQYNQELSETFLGLFDKVTVTGVSSPKSATTIVYLSSDVTLICYVDCTPDLSDSECHTCLRTGLGRLDRDGAYIGRLLQPNCRLMYGFTAIGSPSQDRTFYIPLGISSAIAAISLLLNVSIITFKRKAKRRASGLDAIERKESLQFDFNLIKTATSNFSLENKIGQGGFGVVYKGALTDGKSVAVKRLSKASGQGTREFKAEACLAAKLKHKNLVKLYGFCVHEEEMLLVYEYLVNNSLDKVLFDPKKGDELNWETRYSIIDGIVRGLLYLHEDSRPKIVHRDLKPSNILLDGSMNPKIADFGMAKLFGCDQTQGNTSRVAGTFGYMAPEYARTGNFSAKSDIFSLGIIILEILSGLRNNCQILNLDDEILRDYAQRLWDEGAYLNFIDLKMEKIFSEDQVERCMNIALLCIQEDPAKRPDIASILLMLNTQNVMTLPSPTRPPTPPYRQNYLTYTGTSSHTQAEEMIADLSPR